MAEAFQQLCEHLSSSMNREELYGVAKQLGLQVNNKMTKSDFCSAVSSYALSRVSNFGTFFGAKSQSGGYFDADLNQQIDEDIGNDFADNLYDYDANMENDEDIEDDNGNEDETSYQLGGSLIPIRKRLNIGKSQVGGGNFEIEVPIGLVHRAYIARLIRELPNIRGGAKAKLEFREDKKHSNKNYATGNVWIVTQDQSLLQKLRSKAAAVITKLEDENLNNNSAVTIPSSNSSSSSNSGHTDIVKLPGLIHKRFIGELIKNFPLLKESEFETIKIKYISTVGDDSNVGMGYVQIWSPNSQDEAKKMGDLVKDLIQRLFETAKMETEKRLTREKGKESEKGKGKESEKEKEKEKEKDIPYVPKKSYAKAQEEKVSKAFLQKTSSPSWADDDDNDDDDLPLWERRS